MIIFDDYNILDTLHSGRNFDIFKGIRKNDNLPVILKMVKPGFATLISTEKLKHEYDMGMRIDAPEIVKYIDLIERQNTIALIMEDIGAKDLKGQIPANGFGLSNFLQLAIQITEAISIIHHKDLIHKHINPSNLIWNSETGRVQMIDFAIASEFSIERLDMQPVNKLEGTLSYISPEQTGRMNRSLDYRTDFYSLGITFYEMLTGCLPFFSTDPMEIIHRHIAVTPQPPDVIKRKIPSVISAIIMKLMSKMAENRYQNAFCLKNDLIRCFKALVDQGKIQAFEIGKHDIYTKLRIPENLYGRKRQIAALLDSFTSASKGNKKILMIAGESGSGKSALVNEVYKQIAEKKGYFIAGKFDPLTLGVPYTALLQAFDSLIRQICAESPERLLIWKNAIKDAIGDNGGVLSEMIPEIEFIIGKQPDVPVLPPTETHNRFNIMIQDFIKVFAAPSHPLVVFLDDLQWADNASIQLLEVLINTSQLQHVLFIGAYRDNEVNLGHPLMILLDKFKKENIAYDVIKPIPLNMDHIIELLSDTFSFEYDQSKDLSNLILEKTAGNPFFVKEFLKQLYADNLVYFDKKEWALNLPGIKDAEITANVVELMVGKIEKLPVPTCDTLKLASCFGVLFDISMLASIYQKNQAQVLKDLMPAFNQGMIIKLKEENKFIHDRVHEAAYLLLDEEHREELHYRIGSYFLNHSEKSKDIFTITNQWNMAQKLLNAIEKNHLLEMNIEAGIKAKTSSAYKAACDFFNHAQKLMQKNCWETDYGRTLFLYTQYAEAAYAATDYKLAEKLFECVLKNATSLLDKLKIYQMQILYYENIVMLKEASRLAIKVINEMGISFPEPESITYAETQAKFQIVKTRLNEIGIDAIIDLPKISDPYKREAVGILVSVMLPFWNTYPNALTYLSLTILELTLENGLIPQSGVGISLGASVIADNLGDIDLGFRLANIALKISDKLHDKSYACSPIFMFYSMIYFWKKPFRWGLENLLESYKIGRENGNLQWASYSLNFYCMRYLFAGYHLDTAKLEYDKYLTPMELLKQADADLFYNIPRQTVYNLTGNAKDKYKLVGEAYDEEKTLPVLYAQNNHASIGLTYTCKLLILCILDDFKKALQIALTPNADVCIRTNPGQYQPYIGIFLFALTLLQNHDDVTETQQNEFLAKAIEIQNMLQDLSEKCPMNFSFMSTLLSAEINRITGNSLIAMTLYDQAASQAKDNDFTNFEALSNELASKFYFSQNLDKIGRLYLQEAFTGYEKWGAIIKIQDMHEKYSDIVEFVCALDSPTMDNVDDISLNLDLNTIIKASQIISGELNLKLLLKRLIHILIENSGAQKGFIVMETDGQLIIEASETVDKNKELADETKNIENCNRLSAAVVKYVMRTKETQLYDDAAKSNLFSKDVYLQKENVKSLLCMPIALKEKVFGVLYLENNASDSVFTKKRISTLDVLVTQAAISIENAYLYETLYKSEEKLKAIFDYAPTVIYTKDINFNYLFINKQFEQLFHVKNEHFKGKTDFDVFSEEIATRFRKNDQKVIMQNKPMVFEEFVQQAGGFHSYLSIKFPLTDKDGNCYAICGILNDITELKKAEAALQKAHDELEQRVEARTKELQEKQLQLAHAGRLASLGELATGIAHELGQPLQIIKAASGIIRDEIENDTFDRQVMPSIAKEISEQVDRAATIIGNMRSFARYDDARESETIDIRIPFRQCLVFFQEQFHHHQIALKLEIAKDLPEIRTNPQKFQQICVNLLSNAHYSVNNKKIDPESRFCKQVIVRLYAMPEKKRVLMEIQDNGIGMSHEIQQRCLEPFFTTKQPGEGTGLGLSITNGLLRELNFELEIISSPDKGSLFKVSMPMAIVLK
ncbi:MAG: AAA family ATPase [Desulfobacterales bacterium]|nr:AAA family ATPase [Desulfobacterales bacterium]